MGNGMVTVYYFIQMEEFMKELGVITGCMVKEKLAIRMVKVL
jgi:hypothetical protein